MKKRLRKIFLSFVVFLLLCCIGVIGAVEYWSHTEAGKVPAKTAVLLHAVDQRLVTSDMKAPKIFSSSGSPSYTRTTTSIPMSDGEKIPIRIYQPKKGGPHPIIIYYHGGAFLEGYGNINTHDNIVRALAAKTQNVVISVGYRLAPTHPFPTATEDSYEALLWAVKHASSFNGDPSKIAVAGDSAGGNLATVVTMMARDRNGPSITSQALFYPLTTFQDVAFSSRSLYDSGYYLISRSVMEKARKNYTPEENMWSNPYTSPLEAQNLHDLPPAFIITAEFDPLRDEGEAYGKVLAENGTPVNAVRYNGVMHGFVSFYEVMNRGKDALDEASAYLTESFQQQPKYQAYQLDIYDNQPALESLQDRGEAYAIGGYLLGKQAISKLSSW
ncbi:alpha/beta hydrolase [Metabacillus litoralis]|nr:alpha/beta hydrolase [Metabacillus litoralis]MCM3409442.1 alpha/beta hydrolase [Metabacillus litoralis]